MLAQSAFKNLKGKVFRGGFVFAVFLLFVLVTNCTVYAEETVKIKILAVNPSSTKSLKTTVAQYLPQEVTPDDVLDKDGLSFFVDEGLTARILFLTM